MPCRTARMRSGSLSMPALKTETHTRMNDAGFGIYVHWPFCQSKCPYCDFNSHVASVVDQARFARAYTVELEYMRALTGPREVSSIFFGGGTPSLMDISTVESILGDIARLWGIPSGTEISLEANPTSADATRFRGYRSAGVNRLSLGVQSMSDEALKFLGRLHSVSEAKSAIALAREVFPRLSFDLIYARPGHSPAAWEHELREALHYAVDHLSLYQLTIEEETAFARLYEKGAFHLPDEDAAADLYALTGELCAEAGLSAYEVSNYAKPGAECEHNLVYWRYGDYAGVGAGAHGRIDVGAERRATSMLKLPQAWLEAVETNGIGLEKSEAVSRSEQGDEMMLMGLRLSEGVSLSRFTDMSGRKIPDQRLAELQRDGLLIRAGDRLHATAEGRMVLDALLAKLLV
jgi:putative oxygen-independent coproporphyrinogen III oxidase